MYHGASFLGISVGTFKVCWKIIISNRCHSYVIPSSYNTETILSDEIQYFELGDKIKNLNCFDSKDSVSIMGKTMSTH
jgi:hypothetical protein